MPLRSRSLAFCSALLLVTATAVQAGDAKPLRTLVYAVSFTARNSAEEKTSGFLGGDQGSIKVGSATVKRASNVDDSGTLTVDVVAATLDGALAVDASFAGKTTNQPPVRVAIFSDGRITFDPRYELAPQTTRLLPLLARGFIADRDVSPGSSWQVAAPPPLRGTMTYVVRALRAEQATLSIEGDLALVGPQGYDEHDSGTATYATDRLCPLTYDLTARSRHQTTTEQYVTTSAHLTASLVSDTFAPK